MEDIGSHSQAYQDFLRDYFHGNKLIRIRGEEDVSVWEKLEGIELQMAKNKIISHLYEKDNSYLRAGAIFKDVKAIEPLKVIAKSYIGFWIKSLEKSKALKYFWIAIADDDKLVRYSAYRALENLFLEKCNRAFIKEMDYYIAEEVYNDKHLFRKRMGELKNKIIGW